MHSTLSTRSLIQAAVFITTIAFPIHAKALTPQVAQFIKWETESNAVSKRSAAPFPVQHFEIPLKAIGADLADHLDPKVRDALIFKKNGEDYVRWVINPEDSKWHQEVINWLKKKNLDTKQYTYFTGYLTASRSIIVEAPNGAQFSAKVSTNKTGGNWRDKKQEVGDAEQVRLGANYVDEHIPGPQGEVGDKLRSHPSQKSVADHSHVRAVQFDYLVLLDEPAEFEIEGVDQAMLVRSLGEMTEGKKYYLPGFSAVHDETGRNIAKLNGSSNPAVYWNEHYNKPLGRALGEFMAHFGLAYDSPHSQNFLVELDEKMKPTGRIVLRDFGDSYAYEPLLKALKNKEFLALWEGDNLVQEPMVAVGILHGNEAPTWITDKVYLEWGADFYQEFEKVYSELTGVPVSELQKARLTLNGRYFSKTYDSSTKAFQNYLDLAPCFQGAVKTLSGKECPDRLLKKMSAHVNCSKSLKP